MNLNNLAHCIHYNTCAPGKLFSEVKINSENRHFQVLKILDITLCFWTLLYYVFIYFVALECLGLLAHVITDNSLKQFGIGL